MSSPFYLLFKIRKLAFLLGNARITKVFSFI